MEIKLCVASYMILGKLLKLPESMLLTITYNSLSRKDRVLDMFI